MAVIHSWYAAAVPAQNPNQRCTCGYTKFRQRKTHLVEDVQRWMLFDDTAVGGGFGSTPFGTYFGAGSSGNWGLFDASHHITTFDVSCENCGRVRISKNLGGITVMASYVSGGVFYIVAGDVENTACYSLRLDGPTTSYVVGIVREIAVLPPIAATAPVITTPTPPSTDVIDTLLSAVLPEVAETGEYTVVLVDRCGDVEIPMVTISLEAPPMILRPSDADIGGAPESWLRGGAVLSPIGQPGSGSRRSIPLDFCSDVLEFDARLGSLPSSQGWTHAGAGGVGNFTLVEGGVMRAGTTVALNSYWTQTVAIAASPDRIYAYAVINPITVPGTNPGDGLEVDARYATLVASPYEGVRFNFYDHTIKGTALDGSGEVMPSLTEPPPGWLGIAAGQDASGDEALWGVEEALVSIYGTDGAAGALEVIARFGDVAGTGLLALIRNVVVSFPGRFIRPVFTAFTQVAAPRVRLYLACDANGSAQKTARFRVSYGVISDPYAMPATQVDFTINFVVANSVYEAAVDLPGLTANAPMWFSVERVAGHADDKVEATTHLLYATVRAA